MQRPEWTELEAVAVAAAIGEVDRDLAIAKMCRIVTSGWGPSCRFAMGRAAPKTRSDEQAVPVAKHQDPKAAALLIGVEPALGPDTLLRMSRLFQMLLEALDPYPLVHQLRNRLSGVLLNIEFVEMMLTEAPELGEERIGREQHTQILTAIGHARRASGDIVEILRGAGDASAR